MKPPGARLGLLVGALLTAPLIAVSWLAERLGGLPFIPFVIFEWVTRKLPGAVLTNGIDTMVKLIRSLGLGPTSSVAKVGEELLAVIGVLVAGLLAGAILFALLRAGLPNALLLPGWILGALAGVATLLMDLTVHGADAVGPWAGSIWILLLFLPWGAGLAWSHARLSPRAATALRVRPVEPVRSVEAIDRRQFLIRLGGASAVLTVVGAVVGAVAAEETTRRGGGRPWSATHGLPNAEAAVAPAPGTRKELTPVADHYRIDIDTFPPTLDADTWRLKVAGLVDHPLELTLAQIRAYPSVDRFITLECISNPVAGDLIGTQRWTGVVLRSLLPVFRPRPEASHLLIRSADGYFETVTLDSVRADGRIMLAHAWDGLPLTPVHGFPLRIYIPDVYGMKQPKWITSIEAIDHQEAGYWVVRGWSAQARVRSTSVIDAVATQAAIARTGSNRVPVGGIAFAGARGISRVEVRVDDGAWQRARLRTPLSDLTWVLWRFDWPFRPGRHTFTVRCWDGSGTPQIIEPSPPHPDGATGLVSKRVSL